MSKKEKEGKDLSKPNISFRASPELIQWLKDELGIDETAGAVREAIQHTLTCERRVKQMNQMKQMFHGTYSITQAAAILNKGRSTIWRMIKRGEIRAYHIGKMYSIPKEEIEKFQKPEVTQA